MHGLAWDKVSQDGKNEYCTLTDISIQNINIPYEAISCKDVNCKNEYHRVAINKFYGDIVNAMCNVGDYVFYKYVKVDNLDASKCRPGWSEYTDELHNVARHNFLAWVVAGKPKHGPAFESMKLSRARFKYGLRFLKQHKTQLISNSLDTKLQESKTGKFWKEVNRMNNCKVPLPNSIDGVTGADNITELWKGHFEQLFKCIHNNDITSHHYIMMSHILIIYLVLLMRLNWSLGN